MGNLRAGRSPFRVAFGKIPEFCMDRVRASNKKGCAMHGQYDSKLIAD